MAVILSPAMTAAREHVRKAASVADDDRLDSLIGMAAELVEKEAGGAPQFIKNEAVIRVVAYVSSIRGGGAVASQKLTDSLEWTMPVNHAALFRNCGAKALLAPFKVRRAGCIG